MTVYDFIPLAVLVGVVASSVVQRKASVAVQPLRILLAEKGERFLARSDVPESLRAEVSRTLESPFSCNCYLLFVSLLVLPLLVWFDLGSRRNEARSTEMQRIGHEVRGRYLEIRALSRRIELANHPIISPLAELIVSFSIVLAVPFLLLGHRLDVGTLDRDSASVGVDEYWSHLPKFGRT